MRNITFRKMDEIAFDKTFEVNGNNEFCHATGREMCEGDSGIAGNWWVEFQDSEGGYHYGR